MSFLKRLFGTPDPTPSFTAPLAPDAPVFVVGDIHGCMPHMTKLQTLMQTENPEAHQVYVGDYIDRGDHSADVLRSLYAMRDDPRKTFLRGNHEDMLLGFLQDPIAKGPHWLRYGGLNTLGSFKIAGIASKSDETTLTATADKLRKAMGLDLIHWLDTLPTQWQSGNLAVVHAAADPVLPMALQADQTLKWGHPDFMTTPRTDAIWVAHGHTIVENAHAAAGRIAVDTGAYATGRLTAAHITPTDLRFLQAG